MNNTIIVSGCRRTWPDDLKIQMLSEAQEVGESICSVARSYEIDPAQVRINIALRLIWTSPGQLP